MKFIIKNILTGKIQEFDESTAPIWLKKHMILFWNKKVLTLKAGESIKVEFNVIKRID